jgi:hypothetical protein
VNLEHLFELASYAHAIHEAGIDVEVASVVHGATTRAEA